MRVRLGLGFERRRIGAQLGRLAWMEWWDGLDRSIRRDIIGRDGMLTVHSFGVRLKMRGSHALATENWFVDICLFWETFLFCSTTNPGRHISVG